MQEIISKLKVGMEFKNYKDMCIKLGLEVKLSTNSKAHQFKHISRFCSYEKLGHKITINDVYDQPRGHIEKRGRKITKKSIKETNPRLASQWDDIKNVISCDSITRNDNIKRWWLCDTCNQSILMSTRKRFHSNKAMSDENLTCPYCWASNGSKIVYKALMYSNIPFEMEYMFDDLIGIGNRKLRFDYAISIGEKIYALIEFDGGYHDIQEEIKIHDDLKNDYCKNNKIPLLRIHHSTTSSLNNQLMEFFISLNIVFDKKYIINECELENDESVQRLNKLKNEKETMLRRLSIIENEICNLEQI